MKKKNLKFFFWPTPRQSCRHFTITAWGKAPLCNSATNLTNNITRQTFKVQIKKASTVDYDLKYSILWNVFPGCRLSQAKHDAIWDSVPRQPRPAWTGIDGKNKGLTAYVAASLPSTRPPAVSLSLSSPQNPWMSHFQRVAKLSPHFMN